MYPAWNMPPLAMKTICMRGSRPLMNAKAIMNATTMLSLLDLSLTLETLEKLDAGSTIRVGSVAERLNLADVLGS